MSEDAKVIELSDITDDVDEIEIRVKPEEEDTSDAHFLFDELPEDDQVFDTWEEVERLESLEREGVWMDHPKVPGTRIKIARSDESERMAKKLEREYRSRNKLKDEDDLHSTAYLRIVGLSMFGRAIRDWEFEGVELEFNKANFMAKWKLLRFAMPILQEIAALNRGESEWIERALGNS